MNIEQEIIDAHRRAERAIANEETMVKALPIIGPLFEKATFCYVYENTKIIAGFRSREDFAPLRAMAQKWDKREPNAEEGTISYLARVCGVLVTADISELPPSCKIVEEEVDVPAHKAIRRKVVCS